MTLQELAAETLVQKHIRLKRERCRHELEAQFSSTFFSPQGRFTEVICLDCGKRTRLSALKE